ncbi:MAG: glucose-1-phosphate adenylyltransferase [Myxococcota bacterium]
MTNRILVMVMAGGKGSRLTPLTCHRAKPAVPFGGRYRIIDFVLSNFINSGYRKVYVLTQFMASSLISHINRNWNLYGFGDFIEVVPAQMRMGAHWYRGTADSVYQNLNLIRDVRPEHVAIFGGDHIYKFAINQMQEEHEDSGADLTVAAYPVPVEEAYAFGVLQVNDKGQIVGFQEKPKTNPYTMPNDPTRCLVSMGNYLFRRKILEDALISEASREGTRHDFGHNIIPRLVNEGADVRIYDFDKNRIPGDPPDGRPYWRDVGTVESYFQANMELRSPLPAINLYNRQWRIRTANRDYPPARFVQHSGYRASDIIDSLVCEGAIISSAELHQTVVGYDSFVHAGARLEESITMAGCDIGAGARLRRVLMDKNCSVAPEARLGLDAEADAERFPFITPSGIIVLPKGTHVPVEGPIEFAYDMAELMKNDPHTKEQMARFEGRYVASQRDRHSYESAGPRYERFGPAGAVPE